MVNRDPLIRIFTPHHINLFTNRISILKKPLLLNRVPRIHLLQANNSDILLFVLDSDFPDFNILISYQSIPILLSKLDAKFPFPSIKFLKSVFIKNFNELFVPELGLASQNRVSKTIFIIIFFFLKNFAILIHVEEENFLLFVHSEIYPPVTVPVQA